jgi:hypothetical protein
MNTIVIEISMTDEAFVRINKTFVIKKHKSSER